MSDSYIIDGYNLIHALGMIQKNLAPGGLEESRSRLLDFLAKAYGEYAARVTVVFDAKQAPPGLARQQRYQGLHIHFAPKDQSADDWIETLIEKDAHPRELVVVSNDVRLQNAAKQSGGRSWSHEALLDFIDKRGRPTAPPPAAEKSDEVSSQEMKHWLKEFGWLESDPELKEFFDQDRFD